MQRRRAPRDARATGFTLLAILLILAGLTLVVGITLYRGMEERRNTSLVRHDAAALAIAEVGLERTRAYLASMLLTQPDLDRALDPHLDTNCASPSSSSTAQREDDNVPVFNEVGTSVVQLAPANRRFRKVPHDLDGDGQVDGAYLVRIEDNDDDSEANSVFPGTTSNNNSSGNCTEGSLFLKSNLFRDRDRTVIITVVGIYPGTDETTAHAHKVLRVRVGPKVSAGIVAGGSIDLQGASAVCGQFGNVSVVGDVLNGCFCGSGGSCCGSSNNNCVVEATGTCDSGLEFGGSQSVCIPGSSVPPSPKVHVWSSTNAPPKCTAPPCTPFYYARQSATGGAEVYMWDYNMAPTCRDPQACGRLHPPGETDVAAVQPCPVAPTCWKPVYPSAGVTCSASDPSAIFGTDTVLGAVGSLTAMSPSWPAVSVCDNTTRVWKLTNSGSNTVKASTCTKSTEAYPTVGLPGDPLGSSVIVGDTFEYDSTSAPLLPRGIWLMESNVIMSKPTPSCGTLLGNPPLTPPLSPGWGVSILSVGDIKLQGTSVFSLMPAHPQGITLLAGRDFWLRTGTTQLRTCKTSAAVMVHEQVDLDANTVLEAQLVAENKANCSLTLDQTEAITMHGNTTLAVPVLPPIPVGPQVDILEWAESSY
jgi:hypothetical protein